MFPKSLKWSKELMSKKTRYDGNKLLIIKNFFQCMEKEFSPHTNANAVWNDPPMHWALKKELIGFWCFLNMIGGIEAAKNGKEKSAIEILMAKDYQNKDFNPVIRFWINKQTSKHYEFGLFKAIQENDLFNLEILI